MIQNIDNTESKKYYEKHKEELMQYINDNMEDNRNGGEIMTQEEQNLLFDLIDAEMEEIMGDLSDTDDNDEVENLNNRQDMLVSILSKLDIKRTINPEDK